MNDRIEFGWLREQRTYAGTTFLIEPTSDYDEAICSVLETDQIDMDGWFYPPVMDGPPTRPVEAFQLKNTHVLAVDNQVDGAHSLSSLLILVLSCLKGTRLLPAAWAHLFRVPTKEQQLCDFLVQDVAVIRVLELAVQFWLSNDSTVRRLMIGALHWHSFGRTYMHAFEVFGAQYTVLDACWRMHQAVNKASAPSHAGRVEKIANDLAVPLPAWAILKGKSSDLSTLRNALIHEALWAGEPIGFSHPVAHRNIHRELYHFNSRIILALLGDRTRYTASTIDRNMKMLR